MSRPSRCWGASSKLERLGAVTDAHSCPFWWMWERDAALAPFPGFAVIVARVRGDVAARKEALELIDLSQSRARNWRL